MGFQGGSEAISPAEAVSPPSAGDAEGSGEELDELLAAGKLGDPLLGTEVWRDGLRGEVVSIA